MKVQRYSSTIPDLSISWRLVVIFTRQLLHQLVKGTQYPSGRRLNGHHNQSGHCGVEKCLVSLPEINLQPFRPALKYHMQLWIYSSMKTAAT
jgi:hypothetical protein